MKHIAFINHNFIIFWGRVFGRGEEQKEQIGAAAYITIFTMYYAYLKNDNC